MSGVRGQMTEDRIRKWECGMNMEKHLLSEKIRNLAGSLGIDAIGFREASEFSENVLNQHKRRNPKLTLPNAKSIIMDIKICLVTLTPIFLIVCFEEMF
jgi:hypothetical protein